MYFCFHFVHDNRHSYINVGLAFVRLEIFAVFCGSFFCQGQFVSLRSVMRLLTSAISAVLQIRIYALYSRKRLILAFLLLLYLATTGVTVYAAGMSISSLTCEYISILCACALILNGFWSQPDAYARGYIVYVPALNRKCQRALGSFIGIRNHFMCFCYVSGI